MNLLTNSRSSKVLSVRLVTENKEREMLSVDDELWFTQHTKGRVLGNPQHHGYRGLPLRCVYVPKNRGEEEDVRNPTCAW